MNTDIEKRYNSEFLILLTEEYGYRHWFWFPSMTKDSLERWWKDLPTVNPYFMTPEPLPGDLYQAVEDDEYNLFTSLKSSKQYFTAHIHQDDDSFIVKPDGEKILHKGFCREEDL